MRLCLQASLLPSSTQSEVWRSETFILSCSRSSSLTANPSDHGAVHCGSPQKQREPSSVSSQTRCQDEKSSRRLGPTDQQQCAVTWGRCRLTAAVTGSDSTGTPECTWVYTHRPTAVSPHLAPCCSARVLTNWHRQAVQFSSHLTHTTRLHSRLRLSSHTNTENATFVQLVAGLRLKTCIIDTFPVDGNS